MLRLATLRPAAVFLLLLALAPLGAAAVPPPAASRELPPGLQVPAEAQPEAGFDVDRATAAYLNLLTPEQRASSDAYFEGGYWLQLAGLAVTLVIAWLLLSTGLSRRLADFAQRVAKRRFLATALFGALYTVVYTVLVLPWSFYTDYWREHRYGLATLGVGQWLSEGLIELGVEAVLSALVIALVYAAVRRAGERWWLWAAGITFAMLIFMMVINPVFFSPLLNDYKPLAPGPLRDDLVSLARAHGVPADDIVEFDASKQTTRISANVSGLFGTARIALNDNLLQRTSPQEIRAVMGHEMGHYVLNHGLRLIIYMTLVMAFGFWIVHASIDRLLARFGARFQVQDRNDPAGLPLAVAVLALFLTATTPLTNSIIRQVEAEADAYGLAAANEPHGFAMAAMRLSTYRKLAPGPLEEVVFYDHPSGYARVHRSMTWLAGNLELGRRQLERWPPAAPAPAVPAP